MPRRPSVELRLLTLVAVVVLLAVAGSSFAVSVFVGRLLHHQIEARLRADAVARVQALREYVRDQREEIAEVARTGFEPLISSLPDARADLADVLELQVADPSGRVVAATDEAMVGQDISSSEAFRLGLREPSVGLREPGREGWSAAPIQEGDHLRGVVVADRDSERLDRLLREVTRDYRTLVVLVGSRRDDTIVFHFPHGAAVAHADTAAPMVAATSGSGGFMEAAGPEGRPVLAAHEPVGVQGWGLVVRVDAAEARAPLRKLQVLVVVIGAVVLLGSLGTSLLVARWFATPIERLMLAEARARVGEARFAALAAGARDAIVVADESGRITFVNAAAERLFGWRGPEAVGSQLEVLMPERYRERHRRGMARYLATGETHILDAGPVELEGLRRNGETFPLELSLSAWTEADGRRAFGAIIRDLVERNRVFEDLRAARDEAQRANRVKSEFLANMSHEIRTPMNGVLGMLDLVLGLPLAPEARDYAQTARESAETLLRLLNDVLDLARIESGRLELEHVPFSLRDTLSDMLRAVAVSAAEKGLELVYDIARDVPDGLVGDPVRLRQVVVNLVSNAVKFTHRGEIVLRVGIARAHDHEADLWFEVQDTGIGISEGDLQRVFRAFEQAGPLHLTEGGVGLGLAISRQLVEMMGGEISVDSEVGVGSTFRFTIHVEISDRKLPTPPRSIRGLRVLVVDDNDTNREVLSGILDGWQVESGSAGDGQEALEELWRAEREERPYDVVLLDSQMPRMDGFELARTIRADAGLQHLGLILLSSAERANEVSLSRELGIARYLIKPVDHGDLLRALVGEAEGQEAEPVRRPIVERAARPLRVLVAEDDPVNRRVAVRLLERRGHAVVTVEDGAEAVRAIAEDSFDVVLMDVRMPVMDGLEATRVIRGREAETSGHLPVLAVTAHAMRGDRERILAAGMDDYIAKPIDAGTLYEKLESLAEGLSTAT